MMRMVVMQKVALKQAAVRVTHAHQSPAHRAGDSLLMTPGVNHMQRNKPHRFAVPRCAWLHFSFRQVSPINVHVDALQLTDFD
jgi:hypothetical protein